MKPTAVICKVDYIQLDGVLDIGDKVTLEQVSYEEDTILSFKRVEDGVFRRADVGKWNQHLVGKPKFKQVPDVIAKKGSYLGYKFKAKNGLYYDDTCIRNMIGYKSIGDIFKKDLHKSN